MHQAVEDRIGERRVTDCGMPVFDRQLTGDDCRASPMAIIEDLQEVAAALVGQRRQRPLVDDQHQNYSVTHGSTEKLLIQAMLSSILLLQEMSISHFSKHEVPH